MHPTHHGAITWLVRMVLVALFATVLAAIAVLIVIPRAIHGQALTVLTGSMTPTIRVGSIVLDRPVDPAALQVGDVATYQKSPGEEEYITHRIVAIDTTTVPTTFTFKGDANPGADTKPVPADAIRGEVWFHVPYLGAIRDALHGKGGLGLLGVILLGGYALIQAIGAVRDRRSARSRPPTKSEARDWRIRSNLTVILATFPARVDAATATAEAMGQWGATLLRSDDESFAVLVSQPPENAHAAIELLQSFEPISIDIRESPDLIVSRPTAQDRSQPEASPSAVPQHRAHATA